MERRTTEKQRRDADARLLHELRERVKEKSVLLGAARLFQDTTRPVRTILSEFVELLHPAWQYPEVTAARLTVSGQEWRTSTFADSSWRLTAPVKTSHGADGLLETVYTEERPEECEGPFLAEECELLEALAQEVGSYLDRRHAEKRLHEVERRIGTIFEHVPVVLYEALMTGDYRATWISPNVERVTGFPASRFLDEPEFWISRLHPEDREQVVRRLRSASEGSEVMTEYRWRMANGAYAWFQDHAFLLCRDSDGATPCSLGLWVDITQRKHAELEVERQKEWFGSLVEHATDIITVLDPDGLMRYQSPSIRRILGYAPQELEGKEVFAFIHPDDQPRARDVFAKAIGSPYVPQTTDVRFLAKDGAWRILGVIGQSITQAGRGYVVVNSRDMTATKRMEEDLRFRHALLMTQLEVSIDGVLVVDQDGRIFLYNRRFLDIWGFSDEDVDTKPDAELLTLALDRVADPDAFLARVKALYSLQTETSREEIQLADGRTLDRYSAPITGPDGRYFGRVWMFRDITDYKRIEQSLREAVRRHEELAQIVNRSPAVAFRWRAAEGWPVEFVSENVRQFGYTPGELMSGTVPYAAIVHPDDLRKVAEEVTGYVREGREEFRQEYRIRDKTGTIRWVDDRTWVCRSPDGVVTHYQGVILDISERKRLEGQTEQLARLTLMGHLFSGLGHELKNPLFILKGRLQLLREKLTLHEYDPALAEVGRLDEITGRLDRIMQRFLSLLKPYHPQLKRCSVTAILDQAVDFLSGKWEEHQTRMVTHYAPDLPDVWSDPRGLYEAFLNLLVNAMQAVQEVPRPGVIRVTAAPSNDHVEIRIQDNGPGIAPEHRSRLFEPFFTTRADQAAAGLGLWTARSQVMALKGSITCESQAGEGTTFILRLPALKES